MRKARPFLLLTISLFLAIASSSYVYNWLKEKAVEAKASDPGQVEIVQKEIDTTTVAVATFDIAWGTQLNADMVELVAFPSDYVPDGFHQSLESLEGRILKADLKKNEPILETKLAPMDATVGGVVAVMEPHMRAMAVRVDDEIGVAGFIKPGDRIDLYITMKAAEMDDAVSKMVLESTRVLAIGTEMVRVGPDSEPRPVKVVTLEVTPDEGEKLALGATQGKFRLALRHPLDTEQTLTRGATIQSLLASNRKGGPVQDQVDEARHVVQVIKGGELSTVSF